ncbi:MAG: tetratricopeptide repeat protein [Myxococcales bacterium]|nr:tetratricopeptide repeat protein [Myxococcales bacterium]
MALLTLSGAPGVALAKRPPAKKTESPRAQAIQLFQESRAAYRQGRFRETAALLEKAYALDPAPTLLYNLARALESDGDFEGAVKAYQDYLAADPKADDRAAIAQRIENLQTQIAEREELQRRLREAQARPPPGPAPAPAPIAPAAPEVELTHEAPAARSTPVVPWVVAGLGAAGVAAGGVLGVMARNKHQEADGAPAQADAVLLDEDARSLARGANIAFIAGGAVAAGGLIWGLLQTLGGDDDGSAVSLRVGPTSVGVLGRF